MAEFCLECWNEINETNDSEDKFVLSRNPELCEGCGEWKQVIVGIRITYRIRSALKEFLSRFH